MVSDSLGNFERPREEVIPNIVEAAKGVKARYKTNEYVSGVRQGLRVK